MTTTRPIEGAFDQPGRNRRGVSPDLDYPLLPAGSIPRFERAEASNSFFDGLALFFISLFASALAALIGVAAFVLNALLA